MDSISMGNVRRWPDLALQSETGCEGRGERDRHLSASPASAAGGDRGTAEASRSECNIVTFAREMGERRGYHSVGELWLRIVARLARERR